MNPDLSRTRVLLFFFFLTAAVLSAQSSFSSVSKKLQRLLFFTRLFQFIVEGKMSSGTGKDCISK